MRQIVESEEPSMSREPEKERLRKERPRKEKEAKAWKADSDWWCHPRVPCTVDCFYYHTYGRLSPAHPDPKLAVTSTLSHRQDPASPSP